MLSLAGAVMCPAVPTEAHDHPGPVLRFDRSVAPWSKGGHHDS